MVEGRAKPDLSCCRGQIRVPILGKSRGQRVMLRLTAVLILLATSPALADTMSNSAGSSLDELLKTIGLFIGTYGLAVFLVVYYAIRLYPEIQKERGEWIRQITLLRQLIDPGNRSLTMDQAKVVLQLVSGAFADRLKIAGEPSFAHPRPTSAGAPFGFEFEYLYLFHESIKYEKLNAKTESVEEARRVTDERTAELDRLYRQVVGAIQGKAKETRKTIEELFDTVSELGKRDSYRLALLRFGSVNLEQIWRASYEPTLQEWKSNLKDFLNVFDKYDIDRAREFLSGHPAWRLKEDEYIKYFSGLIFANPREYFNDFQAILDSKIEEQLVHRDRVDAEA
jgi:hypothetical protein